MITPETTVRPQMVHEIMVTEVLTVCEDTPLSHASKLLGQHHVRHLVVVDSLNRPVGVFSERNFLKHIARRIGKGQQVLSRLPVKELMVANPRVISADTSIARTAAIMARMKIGCLSVVDERGRLAGIVSVVDLLKILAMDENDPVE